MGPAAQRAVPALTDVLKNDQFSPCRANYALALVKIERQAAKMAIPALIAVLDGPADSAIRREAAKALGDIGAPAGDAAPALRKALMDPDESIRSEASLALKKIGV